MTLDLAHVWETMGPLGKAVAFVLLCMAIASAGVAVERGIALWKSQRDSRRFARQAGKLLKEWRLEELAKVAGNHRGSALARQFSAVIERYLGAQEGNLGPVALARHESERALETLGSDLRRGLNILASVGSVAPFVGLLGTVIGIIGAFQGIASTGSGGLASVSAGISEALIETAFGLMVAIPAVLLFNWLSAKINNIELAVGRSAGELLDEIENRHDGTESSSAREAA